jgi:glycosyltransferase involved in cell wall biosynthesis
MAVTPAPLVSVITPAYNCAGTLVRAWNSLAAQQGWWENIIVDDGSTDETPRVVAKLAADPRVTVLRKPNGGPGSALNAGIDVASGAYIAFLDADDEYLAGHLSSRIAFMTEHPDVDVLWGGVEVVASRPEDLLVPDAAAGHGMIAITECVVQGTLVVRRHVFDTVRFTEDRAVWWQDFEFVERARRTFKVARFELPTYRYYRDSGASLVDRAKVDWPAKRATAAG